MSAFKMTFILIKGVESINAYFPNTTWFNLYNGEQIDTSFTNFVQLEAPLEIINAHLRGGHIIPFQFPSMTTKACRKNPFGIIVGLNRNSETSHSYAEGELFWDDGESAGKIAFMGKNLLNIILNFLYFVFLNI